MNFMDLNGARTFLTNLREEFSTKADVAQCFKSLSVTGKTVNLFTSTDGTGTAAATFELPEKNFLDQIRTTLEEDFTWSAATYPNSTDPDLDGKVVLVLALKDENSIIKYTFVNLEKIFGNTLFKAAVPEQSGVLTYNGSVQSPAWFNYDPDKMTLSGVTEGTNAGEYTAIFTLKPDFTWQDKSTEPKNITWSIQRGTPVININTGFIAVRKRYDSTARTFQIVDDENPTVSISTADSDTATATLDSANNSFTVHGTGYGETTITLSFSQTQNYNATDISINVAVTGQPDIYTTLLLMGEELPITNEVDGAGVTQPSGYAASINTSVKKFGTGSIATPTNSHYVQSQYFSLGGQDFTIDWWEYKGAYTNSSTGNFQTGVIWARLGGALLLHVLGHGATSQCYFGWYGGSGQWITENVFPNYQWVHFAMVYKHSTSTVYFFINGVLKKTVSTSIPRADNGYVRAGHGDGSDRDGYCPTADLYWDNVRVSDGIARWTSNFTPPGANDY